MMLFRKDGIMKDLFKALNEGIRNLIISETEKRCIPTNKALRKIERMLEKLEKCACSTT